MSSSLLVLLLVAVLYAAGIVLLLDLSLTRVLLGILLLGNGTNLLVVAAGGRTGAAPLVGRYGGAMSDPLVQALVLTAIVITLGVSALMLSLIHRSWSIDQGDDLPEDAEDHEVRRRLERLENEVDDGADGRRDLGSPERSVGSQGVEGSDGSEIVDIDLEDEFDTADCETASEGESARLESPTRREPRGRRPSGGGS